MLNILWLISIALLQCKGALADCDITVGHDLTYDPDGDNYLFKTQEFSCKNLVLLVMENPTDETHTTTIMKGDKIVVESLEPGMSLFTLAEHDMDTATNGEVKVSIEGCDRDWTFLYETEVAVAGLHVTLNSTVAQNEVFDVAVAVKKGLFMSFMLLFRDPSGQGRVLYTVSPTGRLDYTFEGMDVFDEPGTWRLEVAAIGSDREIRTGNNDFADIDFTNKMASDVFPVHVVTRNPKFHVVA